MLLALVVGRHLQSVPLYQERVSVSSTATKGRDGWMDGLIERSNNEVMHNFDSNQQICKDCKESSTFDRHVSSDCQ